MPAFKSASAYPDADVQMWLDLAVTQLDPSRWNSSLINYGTQLFVAHHLVLQTRDQLTVNNGGQPGDVNGIVASKSVDRVSVSYDAQSVAIEKGGHWNMTSYGIRFLQLARMVGAGGMQITGDTTGPYTPVI